MWRVLYRDLKQVEKVVSGMRPSTKAAFYQAIKSLEAEGPTPKGWHVKALQENYKGRMSLRLDYRHRMVYEVLSGVLTITIIEVSTRENAYK